ncbi:cupin domain-containing protein [Streptomyces sp. NPDC088725]|uniref:cupin domain-containing protein n=1 Tax=Streptomyces sp. NPDC088725 TaxID=3365873 RepID=UPI00380A9FD9
MTDAPLLPAGVGTSRLRAYPWATEDNLHGGSPHMHLTCTECYMVLSGRGELHTLTSEGLRRVPLEAGDAVWFTPGTIHRAVNIDSLEVQVIMQNDGLPEAGDAVMTLPEEHLTTPEAYAAAVSLGDGSPEERRERARARRDVAISGFRQLADDVENGRGEALQRFYRTATELVTGRLDTWETAWRAKALKAAETTGEQIAALRRGDFAHLNEAKVAKVPAPPQDVLGMCGFLAPYPRDRADTRI